MRVAYVTILRADDIHSWSGLNYHILECLRAQGFDVDLIGPLHNEMRAFASKAKARVKSVFAGKRYLWTKNEAMLREYAHRAAQQMGRRRYDLIFSPGSEPIAYLPSDVKTPIVFWTDAPFGAMRDYYPWYQNLAAGSLKEAMQCDQVALKRSAAAIYSSEWAAEVAVQTHGADPTKVAVIPFGANVTTSIAPSELETAIERRQQFPWRFLFVGVEWERKGGDKAVAVVSELNRLGYPSELIVVGCDPRKGGPALPSFVKVEGFLDKRTPEGRARLNELYRTSLYFLMPSVAEAYGLVFCEAGAYGLPCLSARTGGIPAIIEDGVNGKLFAPDASPLEFVRFILEAIEPEKYRQLALGSLATFGEKLNWQTSGRKLRTLLERVVLGVPEVSEPRPAEKAFAMTAL